MTAPHTSTEAGGTATALPSTEDLARLAKAITPGPWKAGYTDTHIVGRNGRGVCSTGGYNDTRLPQEQIVAENAANAEAIALLPALLREVIDRREAEAWRPIDTAPKDGCDLLVWYDHDADPYQAPTDPKRLTAYAAWADGGDYIGGKGICVARWFPQHWESTGDYGEGYWLPAAWFAKENSDYERVVNALYWRPLPSTPTTESSHGE